MDDEHCYRVASGRDGRFDGTFVTAVLTTRIYCRPSCPATTPKRENVRFYPTPAAAQEAGFRACKRCRPDAAPGSPEWDARADLVARAVRLIGDGVVEREGVGGLARRLSYSPRQLHRLMAAELGTGPLRLAMAHRVQNARALLESTDLPVTEVAWAAGFGSIRQFNDRVREVFALTPSEIRARRPVTGRAGTAPAGPHPADAPPARTHAVAAQLTYRPPLDLPGTLAFLGRRAVPGVETWDGVTYERVLDLPHGGGVARVDAGAAQERRGTSHPAVTCSLDLEDIRDYAAAVSRMRRLLDLDADPRAVAAALGTDELMGPLVRTQPGRRIPGAVSPFEMAARAVIGQQVSVASARAVCGRIAARFGRPLPVSLGGSRPDPQVATVTPPDQPQTRPPARPQAPPRTHRLHVAFPRAEDLAAASPDQLPLPRRRATTLVTLAGAVAEGRIVLDPGADRDRTERQLLQVPGIGPWTAAYIRMRALGDPDVFLPGDMVLERAMTCGGAGRGRAPTPPQAWKPWRSYAVVHLWATGADPPPLDRTLPPPMRPDRKDSPMTPTRSSATNRRPRTSVTAWDQITLELPARNMDLVLASDGEALVGLRFGTAADHAAWLGAAPRRPEDPVLAAAAGQLRAYAAGRDEGFDVPLHLAGSEFQKAVWAALLEIPYGATTTYGAVAAKLGRPPRAARAVGAAVGSNPVGIIVPCHRVIGADGSLTGFGGGLDNKVALLSREGVTAL